MHDTATIRYSIVLNPDKPERKVYAVETGLQAAKIKLKQIRDENKDVAGDFKLEKF